MKTKKLGYKAIISVIVSAVLLCLPVGAFFMNEGNASRTYAADGSTDLQTEEDGKEPVIIVERMDAAESEVGNGAETGDGETGEESGNGEETEPGAEPEPSPAPEPVCTCTDKCGQYDYDRNCPVCAEHFEKCAYVLPNIRITIKTPDGWYNDSAKVSVSVADVAQSGNFDVSKIEAKIGQNGTWTDITDDRYLEISENCTVYVKVTDQKDRTYEKNRNIKCFDFTKPTLNAAISDGVLTVQASDKESGVKSVYVNGYKFENLDNGTLTIRLEKFDAGYENFLIYAVDNAGNVSENYRTKNPYYKDPADDSDENPAEQLPTSAQPTKPSSATAQVTEHTKTDSDGNTTSQTSLEEQKRQAMKEADEAEKEENSVEESERGKEFYTIQTASDKVFYLIIDRDGDEEMVYFLTEITENDLLNTTSDNSETLPKNSAAIDNGIPVEDSALPNNNTEETAVESPDPETEETAEDGGEENDGEPEKTEEPEEKPQHKENPVVGYIIMGIIAAVAVGGFYYFRFVRKKEDFLDEEDEEDEEEEFENEDEEDEQKDESDFFSQDESDAADTIDD